MYTFKELEAKLVEAEREIAEIKNMVQQLSRKLEGDGVIVLSGSRFKIDKSGSISDYKLKSES